jgi:hypothetical protein
MILHLREKKWIRPHGSVGFNDFTYFCMWLKCIYHGLEDRVPDIEGNKARMWEVKSTP